MSNNLHTRQAVADYIGVSRMTISRWEKIIPIQQHQGHLYSIHKIDIKLWFRQVMKKKRYTNIFYIEPRTGILND